MRSNKQVKKVKANMSDNNHTSAKILPRPEIDLPVTPGNFQRPDPDLIRRLGEVSSATASANLHGIGIRQSYVEGPRAVQKGRHVVGAAITLQFMPQREDIASGYGQEHAEKYSALWAVFETVQPGDVLLIQAYGDMYTGCLGEMLISYFKGRGGGGIVVDGCIRDWPRVQSLDVPLWVRGFTPNYASQATLYPWAYNVPIACSRVLAIPGDIVIADDDGAVVVPQKIAHRLVQDSSAQEDWEAFSRTRLAAGGALSKYYPLSEEGRREYEEWRRMNANGNAAKNSLR
jgi:regulator of RNase E activity RraA